MTDILLAAILLVLILQWNPRLRLPRVIRRWRYTYWTNRKARHG